MRAFQEPVEISNQIRGLSSYDAVELDQQGKLRNPLARSWVPMLWAMMSAVGVGAILFLLASRSSRKAISTDIDSSRSSVQPIPEVEENPYIMPGTDCIAISPPDLYGCLLWNATSILVEEINANIVAPLQPTQLLQSIQPREMTNTNVALYALFVLTALLTGLWAYRFKAAREDDKKLATHIGREDFLSELTGVAAYKIDADRDVRLQSLSPSALLDYFRAETNALIAKKRSAVLLFAGSWSAVRALSYQMLTVADKQQDAATLIGYELGEQVRIKFKEDLAGAAQFMSTFLDDSANQKITPAALRAFVGGFLLHGLSNVSAYKPAFQSAQATQTCELFRSKKLSSENRVAILALLLSSDTASDWKQAATLFAALDAEQRSNVGRLLHEASVVDGATQPACLAGRDFALSAQYMERLSQNLPEDLQGALVVAVDQSTALLTKRV